MDWNEYKALCDTPDVVSRWMLVQTIELLGLESAGEALLAALERALRGAPLAKPPGHKGGAATDMFRLALSLEEAQAVAALVARAAAAGRTTGATSGRGLGGFAEAWEELVAHLAASELTAIGHHGRPDP